MFLISHSTKILFLINLSLLNLFFKGGNIYIFIITPYGSTASPKQQTLLYVFDKLLEKLMAVRDIFTCPLLNYNGQTSYMSS